MAHPEMNTIGLNDKQWTITIRASMCPAQLRSVAIIKLASAELLLHHKDVHVNWPCKLCYAPEYPARFCKEVPETVEQVRAKHTINIEERIPSKAGGNRKSFQAANLPWTMDRLEEALRYGQAGRAKPTTIRSNNIQYSWSPPRSPQQNTGRVQIATPMLPREWKQNKPLVGGDPGGAALKFEEPGRMHHDLDTVDAEGRLAQDGSQTQQHHGLGMEDQEMEREVIRGIAAQECTFIGVAPATDPGLILPVWLAELDGSITDVAATLQCGWLAFWAALRNRDMGLSPPTEEVAQEANEIKKQVLNGMIANLVDEMELHPMDIIAERRASGKTSGKDVTKDELLCDPANHYATMHKRSVTATVSGNYWVRTAQLKGMTMYAREHVFLLDVMADGVARVQLYAYREQVTKNGELVEIGTVTTLSTEVEL
ncbi:hypothetical protein PC114_g24418 [Phytophthora cactorum]|nr:hypothetical protein PC114_g24418 [Phytophthora cactorum]